MVAPLDDPPRPLPAGGATWTWSPDGGGAWTWCRVYHEGPYVPDGVTPRRYGPLARFDPHQPDPAGEPRVDPDGRSVLYVGEDLVTSACEVFGETWEARICPRWRVAAVTPLRPLPLFDLATPGAALSIRARPALANGSEPRARTQAWARAVYEDDPTGSHVAGIRYRTAYNGGLAIAVWDAAGVITTVRRHGVAQDFALMDPFIARRLLLEFADRNIAVVFVSSAACAQCASAAS